LEVMIIANEAKDPRSNFFIS